ncbi:MAG: hypothetical protein IT329_17525 [Caldilineaceae bacterium]|nr:hypothetical protein [Caldilineaceae bacterium]
MRGITRPLTHRLTHRLTRRRSLWAILAGLMIVSLLAATLGPVYSSPTIRTRGAAFARAGTQEIFVDELGNPATSQGGLQIVLSEGAEQPQVTAQPTPAPSQPLADDEIQFVVQRLSPLSTPESDVQTFRLPEQSILPPRAGATLAEPFPIAETLALTPSVEAESGPLQVLRYAPEGPIPLAPFLSVTFNQPMIPLGTVEQLAAEDAPVQLTPGVPGIWRWVGAKTLTFEYAGGENERFPMATVFTATVPAGTASVTGGELAEAVRWSFSTPAPRLTFWLPSGGPQRRDPLFLVGFDQRIDLAAVLETIHVTAGGQPYAVQPASAAEVAADPRAGALAKRIGEGRWLAFRAAEQLPPDTTVTVNIGPGTPSAEGPLTTTEVQSFSFQTYAPLRVIDQWCSYGDECPPMTPFGINFNNPLDPENNFDELVTVSPAVADLAIQHYGSTLQLVGTTQGRTTYAVTLDAELKDVFGQTLGQDQTLTFQTGSAPQALYSSAPPLLTVDPSAGTPTFSVFSTNYDRLRVRAYAVTPQDWPAYQNYLNERWSNSPPPLPGRQVLNSVFQIEAEPDTLVETTIDLSEALSGEVGHLIVLVDDARINIFRRDRYNQNVVAWVQVTQIGLDAFYDNQELLAWTTALTDGHPLAGAEVSFLDGSRTQTTGAEGTATLSLPATSTPLLVARLGGDLAILPQSPYGYYGGWQSYPVQDEARWYVFDDRQMYRPGEEVHLKGWIRRVGAGKGGDVGPLSGATSVRYQVYDPQGSMLVEEITDLNDLGGFDFAFTLPENVNLGYANIYLNVSGAGDVYNTDYYYSIQVQEFRRPEFAVTARNEGEGPFFVDESAVVAVNAAYFAGGPLPNADTTWNVTASPSSYSPPNWPDFVFGKWIPWWWYGERYSEPDGSSSTWNYTSRTDPAGNHFLRMDFSATGDPQPYSVRAEAVVMDVNRQAWAATTSLLIHPADLYVGLRSARTFVEQGQPLEIDAIVTDLDGNPVEDRPIAMRAARQEWKWEKNQWVQEEADVQECAVGSGLEPVRCTFETTEGGEYRITATITDSQGRANLTELTRWVSGGKRPAARQVEREEVMLIPDKESYQPGETAEILVQAPFAPAEALVTINRSGILSSTRFTMSETTTTLRVPIVEAYIPNLYVHVELVGAVERTGDGGGAIPGGTIPGGTIPDLPKRPAYAGGEINLPVPPLSRTLAISATLPAAEFAPGDSTTLDVQVKDASGAPVENAELAIVVVDEAILALTNYQLADPIETFYQQRGSDVNAAYGRASIVLADPQALAEQMMGGRGGGPAEAPAAIATGAPAAAMPAAEGAVMEESESIAADMAMGEADLSKQAGEQTPITIRSNFNPLATFAPSERTDADGRVRVEITLPDNLTRYRVMVVGVAEGRYFGMAESNLTARLPLMVRPSAPRFLNFGDRVELPVVVQNQTDDPLSVDVVVQTSNLTLTAGAGQRVEIPANDRVEVRFPAATDNAGTARLQIAAVSGDYADAATVEMPVYTPATTEAFATYGVLDAGAVVQPILTPSGVYTQFGGLEISTSSTALQTLTDAVLYLMAYPFECSEQIASRILGVASLRDVLAAFKTEGLPPPEEINQAVERDIDRLVQMQNMEGGWPVWTRGRESLPFYSIHAAHALQRARMKDYSVPDSTLQAALDYLRNVENYYPSWYGPETRHALSAYALYVRDLMGDVDTGKARDLLAQYPIEDQSLEAIAWIWQVLSDDASSVDELEAIRRHVDNRAVETASAANFTTSYGDDAYLMLHSNRRTDALLLDALINDQPDSDLIPKVVNGLLSGRRSGRWDNTQENVFVLVALDRYFNTYESVTPDFVANLWLGDTYIGSHEFRERTTDTRQTTVPMGYLADTMPAGGTQDVIIAKEGDGRLYYRLGLRYAPDDLDLDALDMGFTVQRVYEPVDDPGDVQLGEGGVWHIKAGARVRVRLTMVANSRRYHVALVDPLPAGLEAINPALAVSEQVPADPNDRQEGWWWWWTWYEHQNLRDERAEAFTMLLWEGVYNYSYVARATTPGEYIVPPAKAEEMYTPEVFGRSGTDRVIVE